MLLEGIELETIKGLFHFDPVSIVVVVAVGAVIWTQLKANVRWHTSWIETHDSECKEFKQKQTEILSKIQENQGILTTLADAQEHRLERLENWRDKQ